MFTFNGIDFSSLVKVNEIKRPILGPQALTTMTIPGRDGSIYVRKQTDAYTIDVTLSLKEASLSDFTAKMRTVADSLFTDEPAQLIFSDEPDVYYNAVLSDASDMEQLIATGTATIHFYIPDPYRYLTDSGADTNTITQTGTTNFTRPGTADSYPQIEISGTSGTSGSFTIKSDNNQMTFTGSLKTGELLVINSEDLTAYIIQTDGTQVSALRSLDDLDFLVFTKGANSFTITTSGGAVLTQCVLRYNSRFR